MRCALRHRPSSCNKQNNRRTFCWYCTEANVVRCPSSVTEWPVTGDAAPAPHTLLDTPTHIHTHTHPRTITEYKIAKKMYKQCYFFLSLHSLVLNLDCVISFTSQRGSDIFEMLFVPNIKKKKSSKLFITLFFRYFLINIFINYIFIIWNVRFIIP